MALKKNYTLNIPYELGRNNFKDNYAAILTPVQFEGLDNVINKEFHIESAYIRIDSFTGNKNIIEITVGIYKDELNQAFIQSKMYSFTPTIESTVNFIKQGYEYLKTLPEYATAIDC